MKSDLTRGSWNALASTLYAQIRVFGILRTASVFPQRTRTPTWLRLVNPGKVLYLGDPITVGGVAKINSPSVFDAVYTTVRGKPLAAR